jgi:hypothetical protein
MRIEELENWLGQMYGNETLIVLVVLAQMLWWECPCMCLDPFCLSTYRPHSKQTGRTVSAVTARWVATDHSEGYLDATEPALAGHGTQHFTRPFPISHLLPQHFVIPFFTSLTSFAPPHTWSNRTSNKTKNPTRDQQMMNDWLPKTKKQTKNHFIKDEC